MVIKLEPTTALINCSSSAWVTSVFPCAINAFASCFAMAALPTAPTPGTATASCSKKYNIYSRLHQF